MVPQGHMDDPLPIAWQSHLLVVAPDTSRVEHGPEEPVQGAQVSRSIKIVEAHTTDIVVRRHPDKRPVLWIRVPSQGSGAFGIVRSKGRRRCLALLCHCWCLSVLHLFRGVLV